MFLNLVVLNLSSENKTILDDFLYLVFKYLIVKDIIFNNPIYDSDISANILVFNGYLVIFKPLVEFI